MSSWGLGWKRPSDTFRVTLSYGVDDALDDASPRSSRSSSPSSATGVGGSPSFTSSPTMLPQENNHEQLGFRIDLDWTAGEDEDQVALRLQSQVMVALPSPQDTVEIELTEKNGGPRNLENGGVIAESGEGSAANSEVGEDFEQKVGVEMRVVKRREPLKGVMMWRVGGSGQQSDGMGVFVRLMRSNFASGVGGGGGGVAMEGAGAGPGAGVVVAVGCAEHWKSVTLVSLCGLGLSVSIHFV